MVKIIGWLPTFQVGAAVWETKYLPLQIHHAFVLEGSPHQDTKWSV